MKLQTSPVMFSTLRVTWPTVGRTEECHVKHLCLIYCLLQATRHTLLQDQAQCQECHQRCGSTGEPWVCVVTAASTRRTR